METGPSSEPSTERSLLGDNDLSGLRSRWDDVQAAFVDNPKECVQKADTLVAEVVEQLTTGSPMRARGLRRSGLEARALLRRTYVSR